MNNGLLLGLGALVVGGGIAYLAFGARDDGTTDCFNPLVLDTWGKEVGMPILILNEDGTFYQGVGASGQANGFLVWKAGTQSFKVTLDDDWDGARANPPQPFPWDQANPDRLATVNFTRWCANGGIAKADANPAGGGRNQTFAPVNASSLLNFTPIG
jgi:hypothetical protein